MPIRTGLVALWILSPQGAAAADAVTTAPIRYVDVPPLSTEPMRARQDQPWVVWLNFDGGRPNSFIYSGQVGPFDPSEELRAAVVQSARKRWAGYAIRVTGVEPTSGDYDTEFVGPWLDQDPGGAAGVAPAGDCWNNRGGETSFTMLSSGNADGVAEVILQEISHTWGLDHVDDSRDLLYPTTAGSMKTFRDVCSQIVSDTDLTPSSGDCSHHQEACGTLAMQNSHAELLLIFGPTILDTIPPTVTIAAPTDGAMVGPDFDLTFHIADDQQPSIMKLVVEIEGLGSQMDSYISPADHTFGISGLPVGTYNVTVSVEDEAGNPASAAITVQVGEAGPGTTTSTTGGSSGTGPATTSTATTGGSTTTGGPGSTTSDPEPDTDSDGLGEAGDAGGCGCTGAPVPGGWAVVLVPALGRRRRHRSA